MIVVNEVLILKSWDNSNSENDVMLKISDCFNMMSYSLDFISAYKNTKSSIYDWRMIWYTHDRVKF